MVERIVIDASVVAKWFLQEKNSQLALTIHDLHINGKLELHAPIILIYEVLNALLHSRQFSKDELSNSAKALLNYNIQPHPLNGKLADMTTEIAFNTQTTIYDSAYVALAQEIGCKFVTADIKLVHKIRDNMKKSKIFSLDEFKEGC